MKTCVLLLCLVVAIAAEKRTIFEKCKKDDDCGPDRCCINAGFLKFCSDKLDEGQLCTIRSRLGCGCKDGLECQKTGLLVGICTRVSGSGDGTF